MLLLDIADVFTAKRHNDTLERKALVTSNFSISPLPQSIGKYSADVNQSPYGFRNTNPAS